MTARKTYSLPDALASAVDREAARQGLPASTIVREGMERYLSSLRESNLDDWIGKGRSGGSLDHEDLHEAVTEVLERKHAAPKPRRKRPKA